jgi:hypothetical protein
VLAVVTPETKIDTATFPENNSAIDTSDIRKLTEELDWKTYHNDSVDGMKIISFFARNENDSTETMEIKVERKTATEDQEDVSFLMPSSINSEKGMILIFFNQEIIDGKDSAEFDAEGSVFIELKKLKDHSSLGYVPKGQIKTDKNKEVNLLDKCCTFNQLMILFEYRDGEQKSILIPLMSFEEKYAELE